MKRITRLRAWMEGPFIDRWPMSIVFGLIIILPVSALLTAVGLVGTATAGVVQQNVTAQSLMPTDKVDRYVAALNVVQAECRNEYSANETCFDDRPPRSTIAVTDLENLLNETKMQDCVAAGMPVKDVYRYDYFQCPTSAGFGPLYYSILAGTILLSVIGLGFLVVTASYNREAIPRFSGDLWMTPYAFAGLLSLAAPAAGMVITAGVRFASGFSWESVASSTFVGLCSILILSVLLVLDLRTYRPERGYALVLFALSIFSILVYVFAALAVLNWGLYGLVLVGVSAAASLMLVIRTARRYAAARQAALAAVRFTKRFILVAWPVLLAMVAFVLARASKNLLADLGLQVSAWTLLAFGLAWTFFAERFTQ